VGGTEMRASKKFELRNRYLELLNRLEDQREAVAMGDIDEVEILDIATGFEGLVVKYDNELFPSQSPPKDSGDLVKSKIKPFPFIK
jgi:hypothetical protein